MYNSTTILTQTQLVADFLLGKSVWRLVQTSVTNYLTQGYNFLRCCCRSSFLKTNCSLSRGPMRVTTNYIMREFLQTSRAPTLSTPTPSRDPIAFRNFIFTCWGITKFLQRRERGRKRQI